MKKVTFSFKNFFKSFLCYLVSLITVLSTTAAPAFAQVKIPAGRDDEFGENNIIFYNPEQECAPGSKAGPISSNDILMIGDSITEGSMSQLKTKLPNATIKAQTSKQLGGSDSSNPSGVEILKSESNLPKIVVIALGTNNASTSQSDIDEIISIVGSERSLIFTTNYKLGDANYYDANNSKFKAAASASNIGIADWASAVSGNPSKYISASDGYDVHPTDEGKTLFAETIASAVSAFGGAVPVGDTGVPTGGDNVSVTLGYLMQVGYSKESAAAIVGNLINESGVNPLKFEGGATASAGFRAIDSSGNKTFKGGFGLVQWTSTNRVKNLQDYADNHNLEVISLEAQLGFMVEELAGMNFGPSALNAMSLEESTFVIYDKYETPGVSFWTTYDGKYYNDYDPKTLSELDPNKTPAAYKEYMERLNAAQGAIGITPTSGISIGGGGSSIDCPGDGTGGGGSGGGGGGGTPWTGEGVPQYFQSDSRWGSLNYGLDGIHGTNGTSIASSGCGPTSFAMMATALLGKEVLPDDTADVAGKAGMHCHNEKGWCGSYHSITQTLANHYGLSYKDFSVGSRASATQAINDALDAGYMIHTSGSGGAPFTSGGHYIGIYGRTSDGKWMVADSSSRGNALYDPSVVVSSINYDNLRGIK